MEEYEVVKTEDVNAPEVSFELSVKTLPEVVNNKEAFMAYLDKTLEEYKGIVIADESEVTKGKKTVATLRKAKETIDTRRKEVKKELLQPYEEVENFCKSVNTRIDSVISPIVDQLVSYELKRTEEKKSLCEGILQDVIKPLDEKMYQFINSCKFIRNPKWINVEYTPGKVRNEVQKTVSKILQDVAVMQKTFTNRSFATVASKTYKEEGDLSATLLVYKQLEDEAQKGGVVLDTLEKPVDTDPTPNEGAKEYRFSITATPTQFKAVLAFLKENGIHGNVSK